MTVRAPAKVNLFLDVGAVRPDGYHDLCTLMQCVNLGDTLTFARCGAAGVEIHEKAQTCGCPAAENIITRAARALALHCGIEPHLRVEVVKRICVSAGLGGGSSDAAAALVALCRLWDLEIPRAELERIAAALGADVPFFLHGLAALCEGVGECVQPVTPHVWHLVLWNPGLALATADVYRQFDTKPRPSRAPRAFITAYTSGDVHQLAAHVWNNLAPAAEECLPVLVDMQCQCRDAGALAAWVTGSGPTVVGLCASASTASACATKLRAHLPGAHRVIVCRTLAAAPAGGLQCGS